MSVSVSVSVESTAIESVISVMPKVRSRKRPAPPAWVRDLCQGPRQAHPPKKLHLIGAGIQPAIELGTKAVWSKGVGPKVSRSKVMGAKVMGPEVMGSKVMGPHMVVAMTTMATMVPVGSVSFAMSATMAMSVSMAMPTTMTPPGITTPAVDVVQIILGGVAGARGAGAGARARAGAGGATGSGGADAGRARARSLGGLEVPFQVVVQQIDFDRLLLLLLLLLFLFLVLLGLLQLLLGLLLGLPLLLLGAGTLAAGLLLLLLLLGQQDDRLLQHALHLGHLLDGLAEELVGPGAPDALLLLLLGRRGRRGPGILLLEVNVAVEHLALLLLVLQFGQLAHDLYRLSFGGENRGTCLVFLVLVGFLVGWLLFCLDLAFWLSY